ncbi:hypothetical protein HID58_089364 [Brassica napus]|uniref:40S ribosomal protein S30 n=1 Tax=Brassica napus TaxID=3708 RepID=A0ABQ7Y1A4_BRANA|nr:hypothetical protein HID58_089364 [Brassica napus]
MSGSTGARLKFFDLNMSGTSLKKMSVRKRPGKNKRNTKPNAGQYCKSLGLPKRVFEFKGFRQNQKL